MNKLYTHLTQQGILQGKISPIDNVTPQFIGQQYIENQEKLYIANGLTSNSWHLIHSGLLLSLSVKTYNDLLNIPLSTLKEGARCYVEDQYSYYKLVGSEWLFEANYSYQVEEPKDKSVIWFTPLGKVLEKDNSPVTVEELMASISVLVAKIKGLEKRVEYLEEHGVSNPSNPTLTEIIILEDGNPLLLEDGNNIKLETSSEGKER